MNTQRPQLVTGAYQRVYCGTMEWAMMREAFRERFEAEKERTRKLPTEQRITQAAVARRGGLADQKIVSTLLSNDNLGPQVETFIRAIEGLGLTPSAFFASLEGGTSASLNGGTPDKNRAGVTSPDRAIAHTPGISRGADDPADLLARTPRQIRELLAEALLTAGAALLNPTASQSPERSPRATRTTRARASTPRHRRAKGG